MKGKQKDRSCVGRLMSAFGRLVPGAWSGWYSAKAGDGQPCPTLACSQKVGVDGAPLSALGAVDKGVEEATPSGSERACDSHNARVSRRMNVEN